VKHLWRAGVAAVAAVLVAGCTVDVTPVDDPAAEMKRPLTVATFGRVTTTDPAAATDTGSTIYALNVFQRLMSVQVGTGALKPDAATDCWYIDETTYSCGIRKNLSFTNGNELTASDVKFSIERARTLGIPGSSARMLDNIDEMIIPEDDEWRIDFKLKTHDRTFGYALAAPAASIVDEDVYPSDKLWDQWKRPSSSGPFFADVANLDELRLIRYPRYGGATGATSPAVSLKMFSTPEALDRAIATRTVDVLWRVPSDQVPDDGFFTAEVLEGAAVQRLVWNPESPVRNDAAVREWVRDATGPIRTTGAAVPEGAGFSFETFTMGARPEAPDISGELTLGFDSRLPGQEELAGRVKQALEPELQVTLVGDDEAADLQLRLTQAWTNTELAWLQPYIEFPLPGREEAVRELEMAFRTAETLPDAESAARALQEAAAEDATVVPLSQSDETFWMAPGIGFNERNLEHQNWLGPRWQLGLWGFTRV